MSAPSEVFYNNKKVVFFIATYSSTGVPLAQIRLAKALQRRGYDVDFIIGYIPDGLMAPVINNVRVVNLAMPRTYRMLFPIVSYLKNYQPEVIFSAEDHLNIIVAFAAIISRSKAKLSASSRITPYRVYSNKIFTKKWILKYFSIISRARIDALVCVSQDMVKEYENIFGVSKFQCIYNVVSDIDTPDRAREPVNEPWLHDDTVPVVISAGTLSKRKGFADLIHAIKLVNKNTPARLIILGEGHLRKDLQALIEKENLTDFVKLLGYQDNPLKYFSRSKVFALSSYAEGLPNVLVEAMACGCTPVATDCPTGPREVLQDGKYGYLVPMRDPAALAIAIEKALANPIAPELLAEAIAPFTEDEVIRKHQSVLGI